MQHHVLGADTSSELKGGPGGGSRAVANRQRREEASNTSEGQAAAHLLEKLSKGLSCGNGRVEYAVMHHLHSGCMGVGRTYCQPAMCGCGKLGCVVPRGVARLVRLVA